MKKIHSISCGIAKYKFHQREISKLRIGSEVSLRIKKKENGYKDIFVYNEDKEIGELFYEESTQLLPFVSDDKKFRVETLVKKLLPKEEDMISVIVDVKIYCDEEVNVEEYIDNFYGYGGTEEEMEENTIVAERKRIEQEEITKHNKILQKQENQVMKGCLIFIFIIALISGVYYIIKNNPFSSVEKYYIIIERKDYTFSEYGYDEEKIDSIETDNLLEAYKEAFTKYRIDAELSEGLRSDILNAETVGFRLIKSKDEQDVTYLLPKKKRDSIETVVLKNTDGISEKYKLQREKINSQK